MLFVYSCFRSAFVPERDCWLVKRLWILLGLFPRVGYHMPEIRERPLFFLFSPSDLKDGRLCRGADRQSFSTRRLLAASHTRPCSEIVRLCCDSPTDGFYCLNLETSFCQWVTGTMCSSKRRFCKSKASVSPLDLFSVFKVMLLARDGWQIIVMRVRVSRSSHSGPTLDSAVINQQAESRLWVIIPTEWLDGPCGALFSAATERKNPAYSPPLGCLSQSSVSHKSSGIYMQRLDQIKSSSESDLNVDSSVLSSTVGDSGSLHSVTPDFKTLFVWLLSGCWPGVSPATPYCCHFPRCPSTAEWDLHAWGTSEHKELRPAFQ